MVWPNWAGDCFIWAFLWQDNQRPDLFRVCYSQLVVQWIKVAEMTQSWQLGTGRDLSLTVLYENLSWNHLLCGTNTYFLFFLTFTAAFCRLSQDLRLKTPQMSKCVWDCFQIKVYATPTSSHLNLPFILSIWPHNISTKYECVHYFHQVNKSAALCRRVGKSRYIACNRIT